MTETQRNEIQRLRQTGMAYAAIAKMLNLPANTVKSFFRRQKTDTTGAVCEQCKKPIDTLQHPNRRFCSDSCRTKWWNRHQKQEAPFIGICKHCQKEFRMRRRADQVYCSHACYIADRFPKGYAHE